MRFSLRRLGMTWGRIGQQRGKVIHEVPYVFLIIHLG
jgi:hypothetical protein